MKKLYYFITLIIIFFFFISSTNSQLNFQTKPGDNIVPGVKPPLLYYQIKEGSCGEACLFSILRKKGKLVTQPRINRVGGNPGRGLHSNELFKVLRFFKIKHRLISGRIYNYHRYANVLKNIILKGKPILLGVKVYPDTHPYWAIDHFILLVGYNNRTSEFIYNSNIGRYRVSLKKFISVYRGSSLKNISHYKFAIVIN